MRGKINRRTQEQRSLETRSKLIDATLACLYEFGAAHTSTSIVAERAGVSRGALTHHYATKEDLIADAIDHLLREATEEIRTCAKEMRQGNIDLNTFLDKLCEMFLGRLVLITLEHVTEARHNDHLRERMVAVVRDFHGELDNIWREFFVGEGHSNHDVAVTLNLTLCVFRGMGMQSVLRDDPSYFRALRDAWKAQLNLLLERHGEATKKT
jgi:AcrR family transcriptional regulator